MCDGPRLAPRRGIVTCLWGIEAKHASTVDEVPWWEMSPGSGVSCSHDASCRRAFADRRMRSEYSE